MEHWQFFVAGLIVGGFIGWPLGKIIYRKMMSGMID
jgi:hypothetical protein